MSNLSGGKRIGYNIQIPMSAHSHKPNSTWCKNKGHNNKQQMNACHHKPNSTWCKNKGHNNIEQTTNECLLSQA